MNSRGLRLEWEFAVLPKRLRRTWKAIITIINRTYIDDPVPSFAASISFYAILSFLPFMILATSIFGFFVASSQEALTEISNFITKILPVTSSGTIELFFSTIRGRTIYGIIGLAGILWASQRIFSELEYSLNKIWRCHDSRTFIKSKLFALTSVPVMIIFVMISMFVTSILRAAHRGTIPVLNFSLVDVPLIGKIVPVLIPILLSTMLFTGVYYLLPGKWNHFRSAFIGASVAAVLWEIAKWVFEYYVKNYGKELTIYGSFTSVALLFLWVYYSSFVFLVGAEIGSYLQERKERALDRALARDEE